MHLESGKAQGGSEQLADVGLVLDDEEPSLWGPSGHALILYAISGSFLLISRMSYG
jgi:hypothetical protein